MKTKTSKISVFDNDIDAFAWNKRRSISLVWYLEYREHSANLSVALKVIAILICDEAIIFHHVAKQWSKLKFRAEQKFK